MAMLSYALSIPAGFLGPLIIYLVKKDQSRFVAYHSLQVIFLHLALIASSTLCFLLGILIFPIFVAIGLGVAGFIFEVIAAIAAMRGEWFQIPIVGAWALQAAGPPAVGPGTPPQPLMGP
jgi:uncharacterized membrane protein